MHSETLKAIREIKAKNTNLWFCDPNLTQKGDQVVNLSSFLDFLHIVSYYHPIHFMALNTTNKEIMKAGVGGWVGGV